MDRKMPPGQIPLKTWQFFLGCRRILGDAFMQELFKRGIRQVQRWSADPDFAEVDRNPLDHYETMLRRLMEIGREDVARAAVSRQAFIVGCELGLLEPAEPDRETVEAECLDDYPVLTAFHQAIRDGESQDRVRQLWQAAKHELDQTFEAFRAHDGVGREINRK